MNDNNYVVIQGWMCNELKLSGNELLIFALIYGFSQDGESEFSGSRSYIANTFNISKPTVDKTLKSLMDKNLITKRETIINDVKMNRYKISLGVVKKLYWGGKETLLGGKETLLGGGKETLHNNIINKDNNNIDNNIDSPKPPKRTANNLVIMVDNTELSDSLKNTIKDWLDYKKEIKKPYKSERGFQQFINMVAKYSLTYSDDEIINVINKSMASGYQGVVWDWLEKGKKTNSYVDAINNRMSAVDDWLKDMEGRR